MEGEIRRGEEKKTIEKGRSKGENNGSYWRRKMMGVNGGE
jgi:hypothetical protein